MPDRLPDLPKDSKGLDRLAEQLRQAAKNQSDKNLSREQADRLRRKADELMRTASPEQRRQLEELARRVGSDPSKQSAAPPPPGGPEDGRAGGPGTEQRAGPRVAETQQLPERRTEIVDARPDSIEKGVKRRTISELERGPDGGGGGAGGSALDEGVRDAVKGAERAIEQHNVPRERRDLVRRVFQRYVERSAKPAEGGK
ncbi:MAG: hypothetical protein ACOYN0_08615 [Phycisphaerales bacterium]